MICQRLGKRGTILLTLGVVDLAQAATLFFPTGALGSSYEWFGSVAPLWAWGAMWTVAGVVCLAYAFRVDDHIGYVVAIGTKVVWGLGCFAAWLLSEVTVLGGILWLGLAVIVGVVAGWAEPAVIVVQEDDLEP